MGTNPVHRNTKLVDGFSGLCAPCPETGDGQNMTRFCGCRGNLMNAQKRYEKHEMALVHTIGPNRNILFQTHLFGPFLVSCGVL